MSAWRKKVEQAIEQARRDVIELDRRVMRLDARVGGVEGHVENLYQDVEILRRDVENFRNDMAAFRDETRGMRVDMSALAEQSHTTTHSLITAFDTLVGTGTILVTLSEKVADLDARVTALENKKDAA